MILHTGLYRTVFPDCGLRADIQTAAAFAAQGGIDITGQPVSARNRFVPADFHAFSASRTFLRDTVQMIVGFADQRFTAFSPGMLIPLVGVMIQGIQQVAGGFFRDPAASGRKNIIAQLP